MGETMKAILVACFLVGLSAGAQSFHGEFFPKDSVKNPTYNGSVVELFSTQIALAKQAGFQVDELGVVEVSSGYGRETISMAPLIYELRKVCQKNGANAFILDDSYIINKNTKAIIKISGTIYRIKRNYSVQAFSSEDPEIFTRLAGNYMHENQVKDANIRLGLSNYNSQRQTIIEGTLRDAIEDKFKVKFLDEDSWKFTEVGSLPKGCQLAIEKFLGQSIEGLYIWGVISIDSDAFEKLAEIRRIQRLKDLARKNPSDYEEFRVDYFIANGRQPEENGSKKVAKKKKP
jgi:hypothetical protein